MRELPADAGRPVGPPRVVPYRFDLSALVRRSVASLYSHLVTRPTGQALRYGIERQIADLGAPCLSVLDFSEVVVLDYSCADETVAKLIQRYRQEDRPADAYLIARGVGERHRDMIEAVLARHGLALVAEVDGVGFTLLGEIPALEREVWAAVERLAMASAADVATLVDAPAEALAAALDSLASHRVVLRRDEPVPVYCSLTSLLVAG